MQIASDDLPVKYDETPSEDFHGDFKIMVDQNNPATFSVNAVKNDHKAWHLLAARFCHQRCACF